MGASECQDCTTALQLLHGAEAMGRKKFEVMAIQAFTTSITGNLVWGRVVVKACQSFPGAGRAEGIEPPIQKCSVTMPHTPVSDPITWSTRTSFSLHWDPEAPPVQFARSMIFSSCLCL